MATNDLGKTSTGIQPNVAALLSYLAGIVTGLIFFLIEKENRFVRFHAMQSIITFGGAFILQMIVVYMPFFAFLGPIIQLACLVVWIVLMVKAYQGEYFKLPVIGDLAEKNIGV